MTPKEQYEAGKAARKAEREKIMEKGPSAEDKLMPALMLDMLDRFVTAVERIADSMEKT